MGNVFAQTRIDIFKTSFSFSGSLAWNSLSHRLRYPMEVKTKSLKSLFYQGRHILSKKKKKKKNRVTTSRGNLFMLFIGTERTKMTAPVVVKFEAKNKQQKATSFAQRLMQNNPIQPLILNTARGNPSDPSLIKNEPRAPSRVGQIRRGGR